MRLEQLEARAREAVEGLEGHMEPNGAGDHGREPERQLDRHQEADGQGARETQQQRWRRQLQRPVVGDRVLSGAGEGVDVVEHRHTKSGRLSILVQAGGLSAGGGGCGGAAAGGIEGVGALRQVGDEEVLQQVLLSLQRIEGIEREVERRWLREDGLEGEEDAAEEVGLAAAVGAGEVAAAGSGDGGVCGCSGGGFSGGQEGGVLAGARGAGGDGWATRQVDGGLVSA